MDFQKKKAIYLQIGDYVCQQIVLKKWLDTEKIPYVRELAISIEVNPNTVMRSYTYLEEQGVIIMKRGIGFFVADKAYDKTMKLKKQLFLKEELPPIFNAMDLLGVNLEELSKLYNKRGKQ